MGVLVQEVAALYTAFVQNSPSPLPPLAIQYADFAQWQRDWLTGAVLTQQIDYWTTQLADAPALLMLPTDRPRPPVQSFRGASVPFTLSATTTAGLHALIQQSHGTLFMTLLAAFQVLLARYAGQTDICIGAPVANRNRLETEALIGFFVNTLVLRSQVDPAEPFSTLLRQVRTTALAAYAHQDVPFEQLVDAVKPERHLGHAPLFQVMLVLQNTPMAALTLPGLTVAALPSPAVSAKFDLTLNLREADGQLLGTIDYSTDLFDEATIVRMGGHLRHVLDAIIANPACRIGDLPLMDQAEQDQVLVEWNATAADYPAMGTIHAAFEAQAARTPDAIAVEFEGEYLTFAALNARANQLARHLRGLGVGPETVVGLCVERSLDMLVGIVGILKAGGAYVPLDPHYPKDRLARMLDHARPVVLLTQHALLDHLPPHGGPLFCLDSQWDTLADYSADNLPPQTLPGNLAYVIYTSGSTGAPKGIGIVHSAALNLVHGLLDAVYDGRDTLAGMRIGVNASFSFDASVKQLLLVVCGATLVLVPEPLRADPPAFTAAMRDWRLDGIDCTPSQLALWLPEHGSSRLPRHVLIGGEAIDKALWDRLQQQTSNKGGSHFYNMYGPTEATVDTAVSALHLAGETPVLGRPIGNVQVYVLDERLQPAPIGVAGQIHIGGAGLARGYLSQPGLTADKFIPNPFGAAGTRLYQSGDLARYLPDGSLEYLGRIGDQVKLRGFRIELGEIENALAALPGVRDAVVLLREDAPGDQRLAAYLLTQENAAPADAANLTATMQAALRQTLPDYMIPAHILWLDQFPLTPNGKINRKALPAPESSRSDSGYIAPRNTVEDTLAVIWAEVLRLDRVSIEDNFFSLGGHSLLATQVISKLRAAFHIDLPLRALFEAPTIAALAAKLDAARQQPDATTPMLAPPIIPLPRSDEDGGQMPLSFAQQRLWFLDQLDPGSAMYNIPAAIRLSGTLDAAAMGRTFNEVVRRHEALRTSFATVDGAARQIIAPELILTLTPTDLTGLPSAEREARALTLTREEAQIPFDLAQGPLIRISLLRLAADEHLLLLTMHHIVSDGWSMGVLVREVAALYTADVQADGENPPSPLPPLAIQYADFAHWQRRWLSGAVLARQIDYWRGQLAGAPTLLTLPVDRPRPPVQSSRGASVPFVLAADATAGLQTLSQRAGATLFMTLMAAFNVLLARYSGQSDICVGTPIANRNRGEIEALIGFFVNTLVLRSRIDPAATFSSLLQQVRATALNAYAHQDVPFEQLVDAIKPERHLSHSPLFQVMLVLQNTPMDSLDLPGLRLQPVPAASSSAKFDLMLSLSEADGQLSGYMEYSTDLFDAATVTRMLGHFSHLLRAIVADPACRIDDLPLMGAAERDQLLVTWNDTARDYPRHLLIHQLFEAQALQTPEATALVMSGGAHLSYAALNTRANQLAHHLRHHVGVGAAPNPLIAICMERSLDMIVGLLAILKAGAAYVPLDPAYPKDRLAFMLDDSTPVALLTQTSLRDQLPSSLPLVLLDDPAQLAQIARQPANNPDPLDLENSLADRLADKLAYIIYTSGSTGVPKGVAVQHRPVINLIDWVNRQFNVGPADKLLFTTSICFDLSVYDIFGMLAAGGAVRIGSVEETHDPRLLVDILQQEGITFWDSAPAVCNQIVPFLPTVAPSGPASLRLAFFSGDWIPLALPDALKRAFPGCEVIGLGGATEATVWSNFFPITQIAPDWVSIPYGRPIQNARYYVLDARLAPCPIGVPGDLYIGGECLSMGYFRRPELSAASFIPDPFNPAPNARMYRTGDCARVWACGNLEFLGRLDGQIKIRGFRIELGEIEAALCALAGVRDALVIAREDVTRVGTPGVATPGDKRLAAYLVLHEDTAGFDLANVRSALLARLPDYMTPAHFIVLDQFPLTANGKVDRRALPAPDLTRTETGYAAPRTPVEAALAAIWAGILGLEQVGIHDDFFVLGGHSLLAVILIEQMSMAGMRFDVRALFAHPTISGLAALHATGTPGAPGGLDNGPTEVDVPPNGIPAGAAHISPDMITLAQLDAAALESIVRAVPGGAANIQDIYPLAPLQEGILFHHLMSQEGDFYLLPTIIGFDTRPRLDSFLRALQMVIDRHDILRTAVLWDGLPEPLQIVWRQAPMVIEELDALTLDATGGTAVEQLRARFNSRHYRIDVRQAPLLHAFVVFDAAAGRWLLQILTHHLAVDHISLNILIGEIQTILRAEAAQPALQAILPPALPFRNFVAQARLGISRAEHERFFTDLLGRVDEPTAPYGLLDTQGKDSLVTEAKCQLPPQLAQQLRHTARQFGVGVASLIHLAWAQVVGRAAGRQDVVFGTVLFGRMQGGAGADRVLGMFVNTLPLRITIDNRSVSSSVQETHALLTQLLRHEHAPLALAQRCSNVSAPAPLFTALLNYRHSAETNDNPDESAAPAWEGVEVLAGEERTNYPVTLSVDDLGEAFALTAQVRAPIAAQRVCDSMQSALEHLVQALEHSPDAAISSLDVLPVAERTQLLSSWNATAAHYPQHSTIHQLFEAQAARTPQAAAVVYDTVTLTYAELNARSNQLAHHLRAMGVGPDVLVGICVERSPAMIVALLATLKAGGVYLPLDPSYPKDRLAYMLEDAQPAVLLAQQHLLAALPLHLLPADSAVFCIDSDWDSLQSAAATNPLNHSFPRNLAYIIYTSGSTGKPKGVSGQMRALVNRISWIQAAFPCLPGEAHAQKTAINFIDSVTEILCPLLFGGQLHIAPPHTAQDPYAMWQFIKTANIARLVLVPSLLEALLACDAAALCTTLGMIVCSGEALPKALAELARRLLPSTTLLNFYGSSEVTGDVTFHNCSADSERYQSIPLGRPIANTQIYILNADLELAPIGVTGELYLAGDGLARGYLHQPDLTAERFIPNPFSTSGERMYRSGDLGRYLPDGEIDYLGRSDDQVKIRGFRIELGEIEAALTRLPLVRECVVLAREDGATAGAAAGTTTHKRLVAYLVMQEQTTDPAAANADAMLDNTAQDADQLSVTLRRALLQSLPDYMVPSFFIPLRQLPLTPNGKIDRKALPAPDMVRSELGYTAPGTDDEITLATIWAEVLGLDKVGIHDNFFVLGGHSLLVTQVISKLRAAMQVDMPLRALFEAPTVAQLAERIALARHDAAQLAAPDLLPIAPIAPIARGMADRTGDESPPALALSFAQQRLWFLDQLEPGSALYNLPAAIRLTGTLDVAALHRTLNEVVRRHEALRTTFATVDGAACQVIVPVLTLPIGITDLSALPQTDQAAQALMLAQQEAQTPFDLSHGPLIRAHLLRLNGSEPASESASEHIILLTLHHIVADGWSMGVLVREVASLYAAYVQDLPSPLPPLPIQYADFSHWQRQWLSGDVLARQIDYWRGQLAAAPTLLALPTDRPRPALQSYQGASLRFVVPAAVTAAVQALGQRSQSTLFMTLMAAFNVLLARYSGQTDICIGAPIANRNRAEIESLIGFFVNTLVLRTQVDLNASFDALLQQVRATALAAYAHQDVPFEQLVDAIKPERHLGHAPMFQVMLALQNAPMGSLALPGLTLQPLAAQTVSAKFDLTLDIAEADGQLLCALEYDTALFDAATISRMAAHFGNLLHAIALDPACPVGALPLMAPAERQQLLVDWNDSASAYPKTDTIHQLFEAQVARTPAAVALVFDGVQLKGMQLSYAELNAKANQLAHHLRSLGLGPDRLAGICVERSLDMIVGVLAILKAGGAYVPLDPDYPQERLDYMLSNAQPAVLLTQQHLLPLFPSAAIPRFCIDTDWDQLAGCSTDNPRNLTLPGQLAYVLYTSGSTGRPKGVMIAHDSLINLACGQAEKLRQHDCRTVLQFASINFDMSVEEIFPAFLTGASLIIRPASMMAPDADFLQLIEDYQIDAVNLPVAFWHAWVNVLADGQSTVPACLKMVAVGGEKVNAGQYRHWAHTLSKTSPSSPSSPSNGIWINAYGPTESTVNASSYALAFGQQHPGLEIPIGRPIVNTQIYLLDSLLNLAPVGVAGELHIAGDGLARGYLQRPDLTADKFIPNPFGAAGSRMYKSGDLARYLPDGNIDYLGRIDDQVKIRGFRIELGEIDAALAALPAVGACVVLAREDAPGALRLAAYLVPRTALAPGAEEQFLADARTALAHTLPDYMIPAFFMHLAQLPLTPNGKIDRKALPAPDMLRGALGYAAPRNASEEILAAIWSGVLGLDQVGVHDNFFAVGGHSLLATQVISKVRTAFQCDLPLRALFEAPTIAALSDRITLAMQDPAALPVPLIAARPHVLYAPSDGQALPLSFAQQRLWFLDQLDPGSALYNMPAALQLHGALDVSALERALNEIVRRHDALRTSFTTIDNQPSQIIAPALTLRLTPISLSALPPGERDTQVQALVQAEAQTPFDLAAGPLIRARLLQLDENAHVVLLTLHHIVSDGWSMSILIREVAALYAAFVQGLPSPLPELPLQYADYALWQRQWLTGAVLVRQLDYWTGQLANAPTLLKLPTDRPRPALQSYRGASLPFDLGAPLTGDLQTLSQQQQATLFMTLMAAFQVLLVRYSGQSDICIGTPIANRNQPEIESLIGFFVNTLVLRAQVNAADSFASLLQQVRSTALGAYAHQDVPFEQLVDAVKPERHLGHAPLFQVMLVFQNTPAASLDLPGLTLQPVAQDSSSAKFDLTLNLALADGQLSGEFEYNTDLFDAATIVRMARHFSHLLQAIVRDPACRIGDLPLMGAAERQYMLTQWNDTAVVSSTPHSAPLLAHQLFEAQAAIRPDALALVFDGVQMRYGELNARTNQLAHHLRSLGVAPDVMVGLCVERSLEMIIGLLGILKAGGAYVPLDPSYPKDRLAYMLDDVQPALLLTQQHLLPILPQQLPPHSGLRFCLDADWDAVENCPENNPSNPGNPGPLPFTQPVLPGHLAYVIYTSGSTGKPKGVLLQHGGLANLIAAQIQAFAIAPGQRILQFASINFDASTSEIFMALGSGAALMLTSREQLMPGADLQHTLQDGAINVVTLPPVALALLTPDALPGLHTVITAGEACSGALVQQWAAGHTLWNAYGPTESSVCAAFYRCDAQASNAPPIGYPIHNTQLYLLDAQLQPVPIGVAGELHIGGDGLARGYLHQPGLTADKFIPNPFGPAGSRLYKSGDLARYLPNGAIDYLGRIDQQIKLRGFRIELGEIESALLALPVVRDCLVLVREEVVGDPRLIAYLVMQNGQAAAAAALRISLAQSLPGYMIPAHFIGLAAFPLTPNGKIDRKALPAPDRQRDDGGAGGGAEGGMYLAPRNATEEILAAIWAAVLGLDRIGVQDDFFAAGGHSLLAAQVISQVRSAFARDLPLRALFEAPTIAALAQRVLQAGQDPALASAPAIVPLAHTDGPLALSFAQQRLWFLDQLAPGSALYNIPAALRLTGALDAAALTRAVQAVTDRHAALRASFTTIDGAPHQALTVALEFGLPLTDLSGLPPAERTARAQWLMQDEAQTPFDLTTGPLIRGQLLRMAQEDHIVLLTLHHIAADGWSMGVLVQEVAALYTAFVQNSPSPLPPLAIQYADFARWQRDWLTGAVLKQQIDYWTTQLADAPALLTLPTDRPRPPVQSFRGASVPFTLSATTTAGLHALSQQSHGTLFMTLLAAFQVLLARYSGQSDICTGAPVANRTRLETEALIGFFVNTLVLRSQVDPTEPFSTLLRQVRATALAAYAHQDVPFEQLVDALKPERHLGHAPLFQVMLVLQNTPMAALTLPGLTVAALPSPAVSAKFDLTLNLREADGQLIGSFDYSTDLFDESTIVRMSGHLRHVLDAIIANPACRIGDLPLMDQAEQDQVLVAWNATAANCPAMDTIHAAFEAQAVRTPDAIAVEFEGEYLTFAALNARANQLARHLREFGVGPETVVGLCVERSLDMLIGIFGILKAGGAYVPLDPHYPKDRLARMLDHARPVVLLTQHALLDHVPPHDGPLFCLDSQWDGLANYSADNLPPAALPGNLAYVIYTSGSTGAPKGIGIVHSAALNLVHGLLEAVYDSRDSLAGMRIGVNASFSFDASVKQLLLVVCGAALVLVPEPLRADPPAFTAAMRDWRLDGIDCTPSQLALWLPEHGEARLPRHVLIGGEAIDRALWDRLQQQTGSHFYNMYGPTEATVDTAVSALHLAGETPVLGRPIGNVQVYLLDERLQPSPVGVAGQIHIGGAGLARGYLGQPGLTADKFIPNPFGAAGTRLYQSGDLARYLPDGSLEYLGRIGDQVKLRGFRIELGEIENALAALPSVRDAVVLLREDAPGDQRLAAYLLTQEDTAPADAANLTETMQTALRQTLPDYMIPAHFLWLDRFPLTPNGKINRKALPAPESTRSERGYVAPRNAVEDTLAAIWAEVLMLDKVGVHDNFFSLGGHSLLAIKLIERMRRAGLPIDVRTLFATPTIAALAAAGTTASGDVAVPPNRIPAGCDHITPEMLPLLILTSADIAVIGSAVHGGAANIQDIYPLAPLQEGILFHHLMRQQGDIYLLPSTVAFDTRARLDGFLDALQAVIARHDILRTAVLWEGLPEPVQVVWRNAPMVIEEISLDAADGDLVQQLNARYDPHHFRIDVRHAPLLRGYIVQDIAQDRGAGRWLLQILAHHLVSDHTTLELLTEEIRALLHGETLPPALPFRNFVAQARLGISRAEHERFFTAMLAAVDEPTTPFGLLEVRGADAALTEARRNVDPRLAQRIRQRARHLGVSAASLMHLAWAQVLRSASTNGGGNGSAKNQAVVFGTVLFGRMQAGTGADRVMGMFINTLPVCISLGGKRMDDSVRDTHALLTQLLRHEHAPLALAQRCSSIPAPAPLFTALLNYRHNSPPKSGTDPATLPDWDGVAVLAGDERTNYPLVMTVDDMGDAFALTAQVHAAIEAQRICDYMHTALEHLVELLEHAPNSAVDALDVLPAAERHRTLVEWNHTTADYPPIGTMQQMVEAQAARTPESIAVEFDGVQLTYAALNAQANRLAHHLRSLGVGPDVLSAICVERSLEMVIGLLAILKAGGAYMPLDPAYPKERLAYMLRDAKPAVLLTQAHLLAALPEPESTGNSVPYCIDTQAALLAVYPATNPENHTLPGNLAYVIYTSGSTGNPKGVGVQHANLVNFLHAMQNAPGLQPTDRLLAVTSLSFDIAALELFLPLCIGATLILASREAALNPQQLKALIEDGGISVMQATPSTWRMLLNHGWPQPTRKTTQHTTQPLKVLSGGEAMSADLAAQLLRHTPALWNLYGPTETTIWSASHQIKANVTAAADTAPAIGQPIGNTQIYLLDGNLNPVMPGIPGELHIGGDGLARGYLGRPDLTADRFVPNPYGTAGTRMYKTGDLARHLPNGDIHYLGRIDDQVKIRGFRIELGEIETALTALAAVRECVVLAREDAAGGEQRLVAYVVPCAATDLADPSAADQLTAAMRAALLQSLPEYMVPAYFVCLTQWPLTPNGKIDRKALPAPDMVRSTHDYTAPRTPIETTLATVWAEVLGLDKVGIHDDFFALGGHSLLSIKLFGAIKQHFAVNFPLTTIFTAPTVAAIAAIIADGQQDQPIMTQTMTQTPSLLTPLHAAGAGKPLFCVHPVGGSVFFYQHLAQKLGGKFPVIGIQAPESAGLPLRFDNIEQMAAAYCAAIKTAQPNGPYRLAGWSTGGLFALAIAALLEEQGETVAYLGLLDTRPLADDASASEEVELIQAAILTLAALRGSAFSQDERNGMAHQLHALQLSVSELLAEEHAATLLGLLAAWARMDLTPAMLDQLRTRMALTRTHLRQLAQHTLTPVKAPLHYYLPQEADLTQEAALTLMAGWQVDGGQPGNRSSMVTGDHYSMLQEPHAAQLGALMMATLERRA
jgi:amino acid adenylation domain-containing protein